jgi:transketolase
MAASAVEAVERLAADGVDASVLVVSSLNPAPTEDLAEALEDVPVVLSAEAHYVNGALGSLVAETIAEHGLSCRLVRAGLRAMPVGATGTRPHLYDRYGLAPDQLAASALRALGGGAAMPSAPAPVTTGATQTP